MSKKLLLLTSILGLGTLSVSPALANNHTGQMDSSDQMEQTPGGGMDSSDQMEQTPGGGMDSSDQMEQTPAGGMDSSDQMEQTPAGGMDSSDQMEQTPAGGMDSSDQMEQTPGGESSAEAGNIVEVASGNESFSTLATAIEEAGLAETLSDSSSSYTVFAPTNEAFDQLPEGTLEYLLQPENQEILQRVLSYHVLPEQVGSSEISSGEVETLNGGLATAVTDEGVVVNNASVITPDIEASNGVIHAVNRVLLPKDLQSTLAGELGIEESELYQ